MYVSFPTTPDKPLFLAMQRREHLDRLPSPATTAYPMRKKKTSPVCYVSCCRCTSPCGIRDGAQDEYALLRDMLLLKAMAKPPINTMHSCHHPCRQNSGSVHSEYVVPLFLNPRQMPGRPGSSCPKRRFCFPILLARRFPVRRLRYCLQRTSTAPRLCCRSWRSLPR